MKILYIASSPPYPPSIGGNQRTALLHRALAQHGDVDLFLAVDEREIPADHLAEIRRNYRLVGCVAPAPRGTLGPWGVVRPFAPGMVDRAAEYLASRRGDYRVDRRLSAALAGVMNGKKYDVVVGKGLALAMKTGIPPDFPFVLDVDDVEREWFQSQIDNPWSRSPARLVAAWRLAQLRDYVPDLYRRFKYRWLVKARDAALPGLEGAAVLGVPYYPPEGGLPPLAPSDPASRIVMMLGSYYHRPNAEGLDWFVRRAWPQVRAELPDAEFRIIGPGLSPARAVPYARVPGIRILGAVPSVVPHYRDCAITIAPILTGAGINVKVFESYAYGRACVVTPFAYRGYEGCLEHGASTRVAGSPEDFARECAALLRDPAVRDGLSAAGHPRVMTDFAFERFAGVVGETLRGVLRRL